MIEIEASGESCLCDFTFDFYWQHQGSRLDPDKSLSGISFFQMVEALKRGDAVRIKGDAGSRLGSSLGVDLAKFGGGGGPILGTGKIVVDGNVGSRMGISMLHGAIYVSGKIEPPMGNVIEVQTDLTGYRKYISLTDALENRLPLLEPNHGDERGILIADGILRDTVGARNAANREIRVRGDAGMSTGILMKSGLIDVSGSSGRNTGVLMKGGRIVIRGDSEDFTGVEMQGGEIFVGESAGSFACAKMRGGAIYAKKGKPLPPAKVQALSSTEQTTVARVFGLSSLYAMMYCRLGL
ncbi:MAG: tributyrin esterase [Methanothrix sp.]|nr:tributyrin esterase [Methanothrix sp.]